MSSINLVRAGTAMSLLAVASLAPTNARAEQFDLFDVTYTYTQSDALNAKPNMSHYYVRSQMNPMRPKDWTSPVDYRNGTVHVRTEVIDLPNPSVPQAWTLCYIPYKGIAGGYGCTNTSVYSAKGVYERDIDMTTWWQNEDIVWNMGIMGMDLVIKDDKGVFGHTRPDPEHFFPQTVHITMTQVSAGSKYVPTKYPPSGDAGSIGTDAGTPPSDAGSSGEVTPGTDGSNGSGGAAGESGAGIAGTTDTGTAGATAGGTSGATGTTGAGTGGTTAGGTGGSSGTPTDSGTDATASGCAVAKGRAPAAASILSLGLALASFARRRRRR